MSDLFWLSDAQIARLEPYFPKSHGKPRVDDRRVLSGIIFINRNGLRWRDAPPAYDPLKTLYNRWKRWSDKGILAPHTTLLLTAHVEGAAEPNENPVTMCATTVRKRTATELARAKCCRVVAEPPKNDEGRHERRPSSS